MPSEINCNTHVPSSMYGSSSSTIPSPDTFCTKSKEANIIKMTCVIVYLSLFVLKTYAFHSYNIVGYCFCFGYDTGIPSVFQLVEIVFDDRLPQIKNMFFKKV